MTTMKALLTAFAYSVSVNFGYDDRPYGNHEESASTRHERRAFAAEINKRFERDRRKR